MTYANWYKVMTADIEHLCRTATTDRLNEALTNIQKRVARWQQRRKTLGWLSTQPHADRLNRRQRYENECGHIYYLETIYERYARMIWSEYEFRKSMDAATWEAARPYLKA